MQLYDSVKKRIERVGHPSTGSVTVDMLYWRSISGDTIAETDGTGSTTNSSYNEYIFFAGRRIAQSNPSSGNVYYYFADHLGSTRAVTDKNGNACYEVDYLPYGTENTPANFTNTCAATIRYRFTGYERDFETAYGNSAGNDYAFARYYNSRLERFMSGDPLAGYMPDPQTLNRYAYVRNNPLKLVDPSGTYLRAPKGPSPLFFSNCTIDGADFFCGGFFGFGGGWATQCQNDDCSQVYSNTIDGMIVKDAIPPGALVLNCVGPDLSSYACFWASFSLRFVEAGQIPYLVGDARWQFALGLAGRMADAELKRDLTLMAVSPVLGLTGSFASGLLTDSLGSVTGSLVYGENALQTDLYHSFPSSFDSSIIRDGYMTTGTGTYIQYNLSGSVNDAFGVFQLGGYELNDGTFYITHRWFEPIQ